MKCCAKVVHVLAVPYVFTRGRSIPRTQKGTTILTSLQTLPMLLVLRFRCFYDSRLT